MYCIYCGIKIPDNGKYCPGCGTLINWQPTKQQVVQPKTAVNDVNRFSNSTQKAMKPVENNKVQLYGLLITIFLSASCGFMVGVAGLSDCNFYDKKGKGFAIFNIVFSILFGIARLVLFVWLLIKLSKNWEVDPDFDGEMVKIIFGI